MHRNTRIIYLSSTEKGEELLKWLMTLPCEIVFSNTKNEKIKFFPEYDLGISFLYTHKIPETEFSIPYKWINFHPGPLPELGGRNIAYHAIMNNYKSFGATIHYMSEDFDAGEIIETSYFNIDDSDTAGDLIARSHEKLFDLFKKHIPVAIKQKIPSHNQDHLNYFKKSRINDLIELSPEQQKKFRALTAAPLFYGKIKLGDKFYKIIPDLKEKEIHLSYIITTFNKLSYLKIIIYNLMSTIAEDEEIVIADGGSSDGTAEYISLLKSQGIITNYLSDKDNGEAHGFNKGILLSKGELFKLMTDDDAFYYPAVKACKEFMLNHPEVDVIGANTGGVGLSNKNSLNWDEDYYLDFLKWKEGKLKRFFFNGTCLMFRRSSLPLIGFADPNVLLVDMEYTLRMTGVVNLAWCTGIVSVRIFNPHSNDFIYKQRSLEESKRLCLYYNYKYPWERNKKKKSIYKKARSFETKIIKFFRNSEKKMSSPIEPFSSFANAHDYCINWMEEHELNKNIQFIFKSQ